MIAMRSSQPIYERFRPGSLTEFAGNEKARRLADGLIGAGVGGKALFITGPSGTGKTTLARIIAGSIADYQWATLEVDAGSVTMDWLRDVETHWRKSAFGLGGRAYIVNECHGLRADSIRRLLVMLEEIPSHVVFIFTTTNDGADKLFDDQIDSSPLVSRCLPIRLSSQGVSTPFADRLLAVAQAEGIDLDAKRAARIVKDAGNNMRRALSELEALRFAGTVEVAA